MAEWLGNCLLDPPNCNPMAVWLGIWLILIDFDGRLTWDWLISIDFDWFPFNCPGLEPGGGLFEFLAGGSSPVSGSISFKSRWPFDLRARLRVLVPDLESDFCLIRPQFLWGPKALGKRLARPVRFELQLNIDFSRMNGQLIIELNKILIWMAEWLEFLLNF